MDMSFNADDQEESLRLPGHNKLSLQGKDQHPDIVGSFSMKDGQLDGAQSSKLNMSEELQRSEFGVMQVQTKDKKEEEEKERIQFLERPSYRYKQYATRTKSNHQKLEKNSTVKHSFYQMLCRLGTDKQTEIITEATFKDYGMPEGAMQKMLWPYI